MEALIKAASEFLAAILSAVGFVGRPRRRASIRHDLELLRDLEQTPEFVRETAVHGVLIEHISREVFKLTGPRLRRKIEWGSIALAAIIGAVSGYGTYLLDKSGFRWYSLPTAIIAGLMAIAIVGLMTGSNDEGADDATPSTHTAQM